MTNTHKFWKKLKRILRKLAGKDLPKSVTEEPEPRHYVNLKQAPIKETRWQKESTLKYLTKEENITAEPILSRDDLTIPYPHEKTLEEKIQEQWMPKPTTKRKTRDKSHRPPAASHDIGELMKGKGGRHSRYYHKTIKDSPDTKIEEEEN